MRNRLLALAIVAGLSSSLGTALAGDPFMAPTVATSRLAPPKTRFGSSTQQYSGYGYCRGPGWSAAHVKRMAKKARNRARNRAAHR